MTVNHIVIQIFFSLDFLVVYAYC